MKLLSPDAGALETERFLLKPLGRLAAFRISYPWTKDPEIIRNLTYSSASRSPRRVVPEMTRPDNKRKFSYAIIPKGEHDPIGMHMVRKGGYRSAIVSVVVHDRSWWGKDVVAEVRGRLLDHFFADGSIQRFQGMVSSRNFPSVFNYQKLGFQHVGTLHRAKADPISGEVFDLLIFELMRDAWLSKKGAAPR